MIFGNIQNLKEYAFLEDAVKECFDYAGSHDLKAYEKGSHEIDGKRLFVNIVEYQTVEAEKRFWEAHREYLDIHLMLDGTEQIAQNFNMAICSVPCSLRCGSL
ncbi:MAG: YhcH/YjgK/YiaL family protein, partial [Schaedlerella arabinosiphila]|nr:YhcH/YjgK/YiaL family protein [Schaedlerella arabinosiphila]